MFSFCTRANTLEESNYHGGGCVEGTNGASDGVALVEDVTHFQVRSGFRNRRRELVCPGISNCSQKVEADQIGTASSIVLGKRSRLFPKLPLGALQSLADSAFAATRHASL
jgi:hypothetical protein